MKFRSFAVAAAALAALGGCATYDYTNGSAPGGYYSSRPQVEYYGGYGYPYGGYGYPYGGYGYYGNPYGYGAYGGYPYGYGGYPRGHGYYPPYHRPQPRPEDGGSQPQPRPPVVQQPDGERAPWRNLRRIVEENRVRQTAPRAYSEPQIGPPAAPRMAPMPRSESPAMRMRGEDGGYRRPHKLQGEEP